jgi:hypothetical protein
MHAQECKRPDFNEMLQKVWDLLVKHSVEKVVIDGANDSFIKSLKTGSSVRLLKILVRLCLLLSKPYIFAI